MVHLVPSPARRSMITEADEDRNKAGRRGDWALVHAGLDSAIFSIKHTAIYTAGFCRQNIQSSLLHHFTISISTYYSISSLFQSLKDNRVTIMNIFRYLFDILRRRQDDSFVSNLLRQSTPWQHPSGIRQQNGDCSTYALSSSIIRRT